MKKNILFISNYSHNYIGGIEMYHRLIFENIDFFNFYEFPILHDNQNTHFTNKVIDKVKIFEYFKKYNYFLMDNINYPVYLQKINIKFVRTILKYLNKKLNTKKMSSILSSLIDDYKIDKIIISSTYFFDKKFFKKYQEKIYFVQHQTPYFYFENYFLNKKNGYISRINIYKQIIYRILGIKYPFLKYIKNLVVFDELNEKIITDKYKNIDNIFKIPIASKLRIENKKIEKKIEYDFIIPIRIEQQKNIDAIVNFANSNKKLNFVICGEGSLKWKLSNISNIILVNACDNSKIKELYDKSKFLILFSFFEGFPLSIVEALSQGLPCIVANTFPSAKFLIGNNERGFLFDLNDPNYNQKIIDYRKKINYNEASLKCIEFADSKLSKKAFIKNWSDILQKS